MCDVTHVWRDSSTHAAWLFDISDMIHSRAPRRYRPMWTLQHDMACVTWLITSVTWLVYVGDVTHSCAPQRCQPSQTWTFWQNIQTIPVPVRVREIVSRIVHVREKTCSDVDDILTLHHLFITFVSVSQMLYVCGDVFICMIWRLVQILDRYWRHIDPPSLIYNVCKCVTHSLCVSWCVHTCDMKTLSVCHEWFMCVVVHSYVWCEEVLRYDDILTR